jgi:hypothetical protein
MADQYIPRETPMPTLDWSSECTNTRDNVYIENLQVESVEIAGAPINIFPLMGIHNQGSTIDLIGAGYPISSRNTDRV